MERWTNVETSMPPPSGQAVPRRPEDLDPQWLTACLRHAGALADDARVLDFERTRIGEGRGFAGQLERIAVRYDRPQPSAPERIIAKFATDHDPTREMMGWIEAYEREVRFYRELASELGVGTPHCYFAHYDREQRRFCLLLEDLAPARSVDVRVGLSRAQAELVLSEIARLHARFWNRTHEVPWLALDDELVLRVRDRFLASLPRFVERFGTQYPELTAVAKQMGELLAGDEVLAMMGAPPHTLSHNDLHLENIFLPTEQGGRFALIDWQSVATTRHGAGDVARILCVGLRPEDRRAHLPALLRHYHSALRALGVRGYSLRKLKRRVREEMTATVIVGVLAFDTLDFEVAGGQELASIMGERIDVALRDLRVRGLLHLMVMMIRVRRFFARLLRPALRLGA